MKIKLKTLSARITFIVLTALILSTAVIGIFSYILNRQTAIDLNSAKALALAQSVASAVDPEQFAQIMETKQKNEFYQYYKKYLDDVLVKNDLLYLYVLDKKYDENVVYFAEGYINTRGDAEIVLGDTESTSYHDPALFEAIDSGRPTTTDIYVSGEFGKMVSGFAPIMDKTGRVIGVVGVDISIDDVMASSKHFGLITIIIVVLLCLIVGFVISRYMKRSIGKPITDLTKSAQKISQGDIDAIIHTDYSAEIGVLVDSFNKMIDSTKEQARILESLADGDLTIDVTPRCDKDIMSITLIKMIANLNDMFLEINSSISQLSLGSQQVAAVAQNLAQGSTEQAYVVEELSASIASVDSKTKDNAAQALKSAALADTMKIDAQKSSEQMQKMVQAVKEIEQASHSINAVIKVIDDIAFQTNILALNAAVEAARAGEHGKGFSVVAEEVRNLAVKSAAAAQNTSSLIEDSISKAALGTTLANDTSVSLAEIVTGVNESSQIAGDIAQSSKEQTLAISEINNDIDQVSKIVQQNSATSQESAAASEELSRQARILHELVAKFKLKN